MSVMHVGQNHMHKINRLLLQVFKLVCYFWNNIGRAEKWGSFSTSYFQKFSYQSDQYSENQRCHDIMQNDTCKNDFRQSDKLSKMNAKNVLKSQTNQIAKKVLNSYQCFFAKIWNQCCNVVKAFCSSLTLLGLYPQHFIFFMTYKWVQ